jgi:hypothetical protein
LFFVCSFFHNRVGTQCGPLAQYSLDYTVSLMLYGGTILLRVRGNTGTFWVSHHFLF